MGRTYNDRKIHYSRETMSFHSRSSIVKDTEVLGTPDLEETRAWVMYLTQPCREANCTYGSLCHYYHDVNHRRTVSQNYTDGLTCEGAVNMFRDRTFGTALRFHTAKCKQVRCLRGITCNYYHDDSERRTVAQNEHEGITTLQIVRAFKRLQVALGTGKKETHPVKGQRYEQKETSRLLGDEEQEEEYPLSGSLPQISALSGGRKNFGGVDGTFSISLSSNSHDLIISHFEDSTTELIISREGGVRTNKIDQINQEENWSKDAEYGMSVSVDAINSLLKEDEKYAARDLVKFVDPVRWWPECPSH